MFDSTTRKLTAMYFAILLFVALFFSYNWYNVATAELNRGLKRQQEFFEERPRELGNRKSVEIAEQLEERVIEGKRIIFLKIVYSNIIVVGLGAFGSYYLARRTLQPLQEAHDARIRFTADASHELRTPLAAMQAEIEVALRDKSTSKKELNKILNSNLEELSKLSRLSDSLLKLSRQDTSLDLDFETLPAKQIVDSAVRRVEKLAKNKKIKIIKDVKDVDLNVNEDSMEELLIILLDNAIKYSPSKSTVKISGTTKRRQFKISVKDSGPGLTETDKAHIFERFYRADHSRSSRKTNGHGLGLSIAQNIANAHETKVIVDSKPGKGSTFSLYLNVVKRTKSNENSDKK